MVATTFFVGSLFFTAAAYLQLFQSANAREFPLPKTRFVKAENYFRLAAS